MNEEWVQTLGEIRVSEDANEVLAFLRSADGIGEDARWRVLSSALDRLEELQYPDFQQELLKQCVLRSGYDAYSIRSMLNRWLQQQPVPKRNEIIQWLLNNLEESNTSTVENALWTLITVGIRTEALEEKFTDFIREAPSQEIQIIALWGLVWMGYPDTELLEAAVAQLINRRIEVPELLTRCGRGLASLKLLPTFLELFKRTPIPAEVPIFGIDLLTNLLYVLADTAEAHSEVTPEIWDAIAAHGDVLVQKLCFTGGIVEKIDDGRVPDFLLHSLIPVSPEDFREGRFVNPHYHSYLMLNQLSSQNQLNYLHGSLARVDATVRGRILVALKLDAMIDTQNMGAYETSISHVKESCWDIILRLNLEQTSEWITEALRNETGPFAAAELCNLIGYLRVTQSVEKLRSWANQEGWDQKEGLNIVLGLAVIEALGNIGTPEAFAALTVSQVSFAGRYADKSFADTTPRNYGDAFTACLMSADAEQNAQALITQLEEEPRAHPRRWIACASALQDIVRSKPDLMRPYQQRIYALLSRDGIYQSEFLHFLVAAVSHLPQDDKIEQILLDWARSTNHGAIEAVIALAHWHRLQTHSDLLEKIGLFSDELGVWHVSRPLDYSEAFIVGLLFLSNPELFTPALCDLIERGSHREAVQVLRLLRNENVSTVILETLVRRAHAVNQSFRAEGDVLLALSRVDPVRFVHEFRYEISSSWHAAAREAIVYYGGDIEVSFPSNLMAAYLNDPIYVIRRAAARSLANKSPERLREVIDVSAISSDVETRIRAIEAAVWLDDNKAFVSYLKQAKQDREEKVRSAAREASLDRRRVKLSREYLHRILETPANELLTSWHYGQALQKTGDDETLHRLNEAVAEPGLPPNKCAYLRKLRDEVKKNWQEWEKKRKDRLSD